MEIIELLRKKSVNVSKICDKTKFEQNRVSHNLKCLENSAFVTIIPNDNFRQYELDVQTIIPIVDLLEKHVKKYNNMLECCKVI